MSEDSQDKATTNELNHLAGPLEAIDNLIYLARHSADDPARVRSYMDMAEEQMRLVRRAFGSNFRT